MSQTSPTATRDNLAADRTTLANERTLLAYARTALAFLSAGLAIVHFIDCTPALYALAVVLIVLAPIIMVIGLCSYFRFKKLIEKRIN